MIKREKIVDDNFITRVKALDFPQSETKNDIHHSKSLLVDLFESQIISRHLDLEARHLKERGESFYTIGSCGHEGNVAFGFATQYTDMAYLHYRSGAFFVQRSKQLPQSTPLFDLMSSIVAAKSDPIAGGRHKVFGSKVLNVPPQTSTIASHLPKAMGAALAIGRAKDLMLKSELPPRRLVFCSFGDASINHATALSGLNTTRWAAYQGLPLPILFLCEDNGIGISVKTPDGWVERSFKGNRDLKYFQCDGRNLVETLYTAEQAVQYVRSCRRPALVHMRTVRLLGHAGSDVESLYRTQKQIERSEADDPLLHSARIMLAANFLTKDEVLSLYEGTRVRIRRVARYVIGQPKITSAKEVMETLLPHGNEETRAIDTSQQLPEPQLRSDEERRELFGFAFKNLGNQHHMAKLINFALIDILSQFENTVLFGEDVAKKGGVYHVTAGLIERFGVKRVFDSLLDETSILGTAIGLAQNGFLPIPEIQFLAYIHNAEDQIRGEAATLSFFSKGQFTNPMVIRIAGLGYQKGFGGHFHNDNSLAVFRDIPGLILACPANGEDAVKMLRTAIHEAHINKRIVIFIEPIALYMTKDLHQVGDQLYCGKYPELTERIPLGELGIFGESNELAIITYGNGTFLSRKAQKILAEDQAINAKVVDLRWLAPLPEDAIIEAVKDCKRILIVDECRKSGSLSEGLMALLLERQKPLSKVSRLCGDDSFIPLGVAATAVLPSVAGIIQQALALFDDRASEKGGSLKKAPKSLKRANKESKVKKRPAKKSKKKSQVVKAKEEKKVPRVGPVVRLRKAPPA